MGSQQEESLYYGLLESAINKTGDLPSWLLAEDIDLVTQRYAHPNRTPTLCLLS